MARFTDMLCGFYKLVRVPAFINAAVTRVESARFCRYSCISGDIIKF